MGAHGLSGALGKVRAMRRTDWLRAPPSKRALLGSLRPTPKTVTFSTKKITFRGLRREFLLLLPTQGLDGCTWPMWTIGKSEGHAAHRLAPPPLKKGFVGLPAHNTKKVTFFERSEVTFFERSVAIFCG